METGLEKNRRSGQQSRGTVLLFLCLGVVALFFVRALFVASAPLKEEEKIGFIREGNAFYYYDPVTHEALTGQKKIHGAWYMFEPETGAMVTGFYQHTAETNPNGGPKLCYYDKNGIMAKGQKKIDGFWYYFKPGSGEMYTGWLRIDGQDKTVYYNEEGHMLYGEQQIDGETYVFEKGTGRLLSGKAPIE